jgi:hypothetical protein
MELVDSQIGRLEDYGLCALAVNLPIP